MSSCGYVTARSRTTAPSCHALPRQSHWFQALRMIGPAGRYICALVQPRQGYLNGISEMIRNYLFLLLFLASTLTQAQTPRVVDVPTRTGVTQRFLLLQPEQAQQTKAAVSLFAGGDGGVQLAADGAIGGLHQYATHAR